MIDATATVRPIVEQTRRAIDSGLYFVALISALTIPDMLAALGSENGRATGKKYRTWLTDHLPHYDAATAQRVWDFRCSLLHQGSARPAGQPPIAFIDPTGSDIQIHMITTRIWDGDVLEEVVFWISVPNFIAEIEHASEDWLAKFGESRYVQSNLERFARRRPEGLSPHVGAAPGLNLIYTGDLPSPVAVIA